MGQKISHIFSSTGISNPGTRDFSQNQVFARDNSVRDSWYPATEKPKNVSPCPPYITIALRRVPPVLGSQEIPVAKKCPPPSPPLFHISARLVFVPNGHGQKTCSEKFLVPGIFLIPVLENFSQISNRILNFFQISGRKAILGF